MKRTKSENVFNVFNILFMIALTIIFVYPYLNTIAISLNDGMDTMTGGITIFPRRFTLVNYKTIFESQQVPRAFILTVCITVVHTLVSLLVTTGTAYAIS